MATTLFWVGVAAIAIGCWIDIHDQRRFQQQARQDLAARPSKVDRDVASTLADEPFMELDALWAADHDIDFINTAGGLR